MILIDGHHLAIRHIESISLITRDVDLEKTIPTDQWSFTVVMVSGNRYKYTASFDECCSKREYISVSIMEL